MAQFPAHRVDDRTPHGYRIVATVAQHGLYAVHCRRIELSDNEETLVYVTSHLPSGMSVRRDERQADAELACLLWHQLAGDHGKDWAFGEVPSIEETAPLVPVRVEVGERVAAARAAKLPPPPAST